MEMLSTYRLQFHKAFTFRDAAAIVPYLHELGITHLYASPYLKAVAGSTHGYDVIDHSQLNPEIGNEADYQYFVETLAAHGMSHILDTVPNHMGVDTNQNQWWNDVLAQGRVSKFANYFDIDWDQYPARPQLVDKVLLPVLGETYCLALEKGSLQLRQQEDGLFVYYYDRRFPIDPKSKRDEDLGRLLDSQHYRLSLWRVAADEINYRRFFDVTSLAALQMERQEVFDAAHDFTFQLIAQGSVAGLRVDHPDGLRDPKQYFERLQEKYRQQCPAQAAGGKPLYVSVEKILNGDEALRDDWAVAGTSGYDFLCAVNDLFVASENEPRMTEIYQAFVEDRTQYADLVYQKKCMILDTSLNSEMTSLTSRLDDLAQSEISSRDFTKRQLRAGLRAIIACFGVYRSYVSIQGVTKSDIAVVEQAVNEAALRNPEIALEVLHYVRDAVLLRYRASRAKQLEFAQRFQQLTSPVNAKGIEDTAFYIYNRLTSLNEVGGDPGRFGRGSQAIHRYLQDKNRQWPGALSSLSTHDTKRSEDVRARISVLSEIPVEWEKQLKNWRLLNAAICGSIHPNDQYLLYQTLLGAWPLAAMDQTQRSIFAERIKAYMQKAMREAKLRTTWTAVNSEYESCVARVVVDLIEPAKSQKFLDQFIPFQNKISRLGWLNSLSQTVIRLTAPGIPDTYQGSELWDYSLVDPDNRRPVDYVERKRMLDEIKQASIKSLVDQMEDGRIKLWITWKLLQLRGRLPEIFTNGEYSPVEVSGERAANIFAFIRSANGQCVINVVPRLVAALGDNAWSGTFISVPSDSQASRFENIFTGQHYDTGKNHRLCVSDLLGEFPVAVLVAN